MTSLLAERVLVSEEMDDPSLPTDQLHGALSGLARLNRVSNSARIVWSPIQRLARELAPTPVRVLDVATGAGDIPIALWRRARRAGLAIDILGVDISPRTIEFARRQAQQADAAVRFEQRSALADEMPQGYDVVMCSLFLHHLDRESAVAVLGRMSAAAGRLGLISDLRRSAYGLVLAYTASRLLSQSPVVHADAVQSVRAAFTIPELEKMAEEARLPPFHISRQWPARMLLAWNGPKR
jgi:2-polyprenyl-3-methyl-5-hydroxy-6-metoxy-1,4-benzoquinol methylase